MSFLLEARFKNTMKSQELDDEKISKKRLFWRWVFWAGIGFFLFISLVTMTRYSSSMGEVKELIVKMSDLEAEMTLLTERRKVLMDGLKWFIPYAIVASVWINVARYRIRKLKKLAQK